MLLVTLSVQRLQGRRVEELSRDHSRNRSPLNQYENRNYIVMEFKVHGKGVDGFDNKSKWRIFTICGGASSVDVWLAPGRRGQQNGHNRAKVEVPRNG
jgi:hypothetical protein